ncbi:AP2 domain-containing protein (plasmid) [Aliirhizobium terrae]|uniref:AP2 domain-containing protein n=1 Tax=Terrirhizobium terrae TaxID=2926709 RepID=UPI00257863B1|nr:AP2 domain-containing protein [Rhizobium sp. CC-CFT758]WJH37675.1 AP2 domain-containing protein [Rhizobium sp. CC-CFT758]
MGSKGKSRAGQPPQDDAATYALTREEPNKNRGAGWSVALRRRGHRIVRLFKDSIYGSSEASYEQAQAYRDAIIAALPPRTNHEQAVKIRKNNQSGISGVRRVETEQGDVWQATLMTNEGQKKESFSIGRYGEEAAKSMAIAQRARWLRGLPVKHLAYAHHAEAVTRERFAEQLVSATDVLPQVQISDQEVVARIAAVNAQFDAARPPRLRVRVKSYGRDRVSIAVSDGGQPAQRKLVHISTASMSAAEIRAILKARISTTIEEIYDAGIARWFAEAHGDALLAEDTTDLSEGFNVLVWVPLRTGSKPWRPPDL